MGIKVHKSQEKTLDLAILDLGKSENFSGMNLVALYSISTERLQKVNRSIRLPIIRDAYAELNLKFDATKERFSGLW